MANTNKPGANVRPAASSSSNLQAMQQQAGVVGMASGAMSAAGGGVRPGQQPTPQQLQQMMQAQAAIHAQFAATAPGRAPSPGMPVTITVPLRTPNGQTMVHPVPLPAEFIAAKRDFVNQNLHLVPQGHINIFQAYQQWAAAGGARQVGSMAVPAASTAASSGGAPSAKRVKTEPGVAATGAAARPAGLPTSAALPNAALLHQQQAMAMAMAGMARPPLAPGSLPGAPGMAHISAAQQAVYAQQRLQQALLQRPKFAPIMRPASEDERQFVPRQRLQALVRQVGLSMSILNAKATEEAEEALRAVAEDFISSAASFAVAMARRRKCEEVEPADLLLYLERTWQLQVPGFSSGDIKPYQRQQSSADHQRRMAAVRKTMAAAAAASGGGKEGAQGPTAVAAGAAGGGAAAAGAAGVQQASGAAAAAGSTPAKQHGVGGAGGAEPKGAAAAVPGSTGGGQGRDGGGGGTPAAAKQQQKQQQQRQPARQAAAAAEGQDEDDDMPTLDADAVAANGKP